MAGTEYGATRQIWLAKPDAPETKWSFLINDESTTKTGAVFGRTLRLGDPITTGPEGTWLQQTWEGGRDQQTWRDEAMYDRGTADTFSDLGTVRLQRGFKEIAGVPRRSVTGWSVQPGNFGYQTNVPLYIGERNVITGHNKMMPDEDPDTVSPVPSGNFKLRKYNPQTDSLTEIDDFGGAITNISRYNDEDGTGTAGEGWMVITTSHTSPNRSMIHVFNLNNETVTKQEKIHSGLWIYPHAAVPFLDGTFYGAGNELWYRRWTTGVQHTMVKRFSGWNSIHGLTVWNNRLWFATENWGGRTAVWTSDGTTCTQVFSFNQNISVINMEPHYGSLYISGQRQTGIPGTQGVIGEIWRYNGSSLSRLYSEGSGDTHKDRRFGNCVSWGKYLAWGRPGYPESPYPGIMLYDPDLDAICEGPSIELEATSTSDQWVDSLTVWGTNLVAGFRDNRTYAGTDVVSPSWLAFVRPGGEVNHVVDSDFEDVSFGAQPAVRTQFIRSSRYAGESGTEAEDKVWLSVKLRVRVPANTSIDVKAVLDESDTETDIATIETPGHSNWHTVTVPVKEDGAGGFLQSRDVRYVLYLHNSTENSNSTATPRVDLLGVTYMVAPQKRRTWGMRVVTSDAQPTLAGETNGLATAAALEAKLEELFFERAPVLFWEPRPDGSTPDDEDAINVIITNWNNPTWRRDTRSTAVNGEVGLTLVEVLT